METCPHYLFFKAEEIADGATQWKCAPPVRGARNRELLWEALADGVIDLIATDHSPCPPALKSLEQGDFRTAWGGVASLSLALSVVWTEAKRRGLSLADVVRWMSTQPARLAGLSAAKGAIAPGRDADFVFFDPDAVYRVTPAHLHFRHAVTPYLGRTLHGLVHRTMVRGHVVFQNGAVLDGCPGRECTVNQWSSAW